MEPVCVAGVQVIRVVVGEQAVGDREERRVGVRVSIRAGAAQDGYVVRVQNEDAPTGVDIYRVVDTRGRGKGCERRKRRQEP